LINSKKIRKREKQILIKDHNSISRFQKGKRKKTKKMKLLLKNRSLKMLKMLRLKNKLNNNLKYLKICRYLLEILLYLL
jgi:hypothetical protein